MSTDINEVSEYEQQAIDFANRTGTTMTILGSEFRKHFDTDKQKREVYRIRLSRNGEDYEFNFGSSINDSCKPVAKIETDGPVEAYCGLRSRTTGISFTHTIKTTYQKLRDLRDGKMQAKDIIDLKQVDKDYLQHLEQVKYVNKKRPAHDKIATWVRARIDKIISDRLSEMLKEATSETERWERADNPIPPSLYDVLTCLTKYDPGTFENFCGDFGYDTDSRSAERTYHAVVEEWKNVERLFGDVLEELCEIQ